MIREDFLLRVIRQVMLLLAGSRKQREEARYDDALGTVDQASRSLLGLDLGTVTSLGHGTILGFLSPTGSLDLSRAAGLAMLLQERGAILALQGDEEGAGRSCLRCIRLWLAIAERAPRPDTATEQDPVVVDEALLGDLAALADESPVDRLSAPDRAALELLLAPVR